MKTKMPPKTPDEMPLSEKMIENERYYHNGEYYRRFFIKEDVALAVKKLIQYVNGDAPRDKSKLYVGAFEVNQKIDEIFGEIGTK